jgi:hypothetical protein
VKEVIFVKAKNVFMAFDEAIRFHDEVNAQKRLVGSLPDQDGIQHVFLKALRHHEIKKWRF